MRLLSILALLFLISFLLHGGLKERVAPDGRAVQSAEAAEEVTEAADAADMQPEQEKFSSLVFSQPYPVRHFDFEREPVFSAIEIEIMNLIIGRNDDSFKEKNYLCAVGYEFPQAQQGKRRAPARREVVVYWKEGKALYRWRGGDPRAAREDFYNARSLMYSRSILLDPGQSVVGEGEEEAGDKFDDYKERAENVIADCEVHGRVYVIEPFTPPPRGFKRPESDPRPTPAAAPPAPKPSAPKPSAPKPSAPKPPAPEPFAPVQPVPDLPALMPPAPEPSAPEPPASEPPAPEPPAPALPSLTPPGLAPPAPVVPSSSSPVV